MFFQKLTNIVKFQQVDRIFLKGDMPLLVLLSILLSNANNEDLMVYK